MHLDSLAELALASRLAALSENLYQSLDDVLQATGSTLQGHWIPVLRFLWDKGPSSVTDLSLHLGQPHNAVNQLSSSLVREGLLERRGDGTNESRQVLEMTEAARHAMRQLEPMWCALRRAVTRDFNGPTRALLAALGSAEEALRNRSLADSIVAEHTALMAMPVEIVPYESRWQEDFERLNMAWLERYFVVEAVDRAMLGDPETQILQAGGAVLLARVADQMIGTCALLCESPGVFELSKMAVEEGWQGVGAGRKLLSAAIAEFHRLGGRRLFLESNSLLKKALGMYERAGFVLQPSVREGSHYARADVYMVYDPR
jgi:DNA-binding MarR family transcriptional regulator